MSFSLQARVKAWATACFGDGWSANGADRNHRFLEEALELVQAYGCTQAEAHDLVHYVYARPVGEPTQEVGGVLLTLAAICVVRGIDMDAAGEAEMIRVWKKIDAIRAKEAAKPKVSALPMATPIDGLLDAVESVLSSEVGVLAHLQGVDVETFEAWPAMDALMLAMDEVRPGWRQRALGGA